MKQKWLNAVREFQKRFDTPLAEEGTALAQCPAAHRELNKRITTEEVGETRVKGILAGSLVEIADGCADSIYVIAHAINQLGRRPNAQLDAAANVLLSETLQRLELAFEGGPGVTEACLDRQLSYAEIVIRGIAAAYEIPLDEVFAEVHRSNMTKVFPDGKGRKDEGGKVLKPLGYSKPDIEGVLRAYKSL